MNTSWDEERRNYRGGQNRPDLDRRPQDARSRSRRRGPIRRTSIRCGSATPSTSSPIATASATSGRTTRRSKQLAQLTKFTDFDVKSLDAGGGAVVFEQAGYIHELDPKTGKTHVVDDHGGRRLPVDDAALGGRHQPHDEHRRSRRPASAWWSRRAARSSRSPPRRATCATSRNSSGSAERDPAWSPDGKWISYFSDKSGEYKLVIEAQDGLDAAARDRVAEADALLHAVVVARLEEAALHRHQPQRVGAGRRDRPGEDRRQRSVDGAAAHAHPSWSPDSKWVAYASAPQLALPRDLRRNVETGETKQVTDGLADAM